MTFDLDWHKRGLVIHFKGVVDGKTLLSATYAVQNDERFDELLYMVADYTDCSEFSASGIDLDQAIAMTVASSLTNRKFRLARISTNPQVIAAADRYTAMPLNAFTVQTFPTLETAFEWLGVENL